MNPIQEYYDKEKNFSIHCFWDSGFQVWFGDQVNGYVTPYVTPYEICETWEEVEEVFRKKLEEGKDG